jgi:hypothetical protein
MHLQACYDMPVDLLASTTKICPHAACEDGSHTIASRFGGFINMPSAPDTFNAQLDTRRCG